MSDGGLADRLDELFTAARTDDGRRMSYAKVAKALEEQQQVYVSREYLRQLRVGTSTNPSLKLLEALARFFGVTGGYLLNGNAALDSEPGPPHPCSIPIVGESGSGKAHFLAQLRKRLENSEGPLDPEQAHVVHGPPGTGTTDLIAQLIEKALADGQTVLIAASSNAGGTDSPLRIIEFQRGSRRAIEELQQWLATQQPISGAPEDSSRAVDDLAELAEPTPYI